MSFIFENKLLLFLSRLSRGVLLQLEEFCEISRIHRIKKRGIWGENSIIAKSAIITNAQGDRERLIVGNNTYIDGIIQIFPYGQGVRIGDNCYLGVNSRIWAANKVEIGNNVLISHNVNIIDTDSHEISDIERERSAKLQFKYGLPNNSGSIKTAPIIIKDNAWISYNVSILKGVTIGKGAIIGCGAVVTHDIPDYYLAVGNPAIIKKKLK